MEKHACKLCFRRFPTGQALGGHMRCHATAASSDEAPPPPTEGSMQSYRLRENPRKSVRLADAYFSSPFADAAFDAALDDSSYSIDSDAESHPIPEFHRQQSKRRRRSPPEVAPAAEQPEPVSSVSDVTTEEDVAISLVLLSREAWIMEEAEQNEPAGKMHRRIPEPPQAVQCEHCTKEFSSCQALGGHCASDKKRNVSCAAAESFLVDVNPDLQHEYGICSRVFSSGQALGGHRRAHLCSTSVASPSASLPPRAAFLFDLNRPPPDDVAELSVVSGDCDRLGN